MPMKKYLFDISGALIYKDVVEADDEVEAVEYLKQMLLEDGATKEDIRNSTIEIREYC